MIFLPVLCCVASLSIFPKTNTSQGDVEISSKFGIVEVRLFLKRDTMFRSERSAERSGQPRAFRLGRCGMNSGRVRWQRKGTISWLTRSAEKYLIMSYNQRGPRFAKSSVAFAPTIFPSISKIINLVIARRCAGVGRHDDHACASCLWRLYDVIAARDEKTSVRRVDCRVNWTVEARSRKFLSVSTVFPLGKAPL